jgi:osmotically-inducible protein OsmY
MAVLTLSRQSGSFGTQISNALVESLKYRFLDKDSLDKALAKYGISPASLEKYDEKKPSFWEIFSSERNRYLHFLKTVIYGFAMEGNGLVLGRGGQVLLAGIPGIYHVRVIAPPTVRIERIKAAYRCEARQAEQIMRHSDQGRAGFHRFFYNVNWEDGSLYDLVINTQTFTVETAVELLREMIALCDSKEQQKSRELRLKDLCLKQEVETAILYTENIPVKFLETEVHDGVVTLNGTVNSRAAVTRCEETAKAVPGVKQVDNRIFYSTELYGYMPHT